MTTTRVAVNGYAVIGKRVADAVRAMPDMELVGVADVASHWRIRTATGPDRHRPQHVRHCAQIRSGAATAGPRYSGVQPKRNQEEAKK